MGHVGSGQADPARSPLATESPHNPLPHSQVATLVPVLVSQSDIRAAQAGPVPLSSDKKIKMFAALEAGLRLRERRELGVGDLPLLCPVECPALSSPV